MTIVDALKAMLAGNAIYRATNSDMKRIGYYYIHNGHVVQNKMPTSLRLTCEDLHAEWNAVPLEQALSYIDAGIALSENA